MSASLTEGKVLLPLNFTTSVLGVEAAQRLRDKKVIQTIRSRKGTAPFLRSRGTYVNILLDKEILYSARITEIDRMSSLNDLSQIDAEIGGFNDIEELRAALKRAGFRYKNLDRYGAFRIGLLPRRE